MTTFTPARRPASLGIGQVAASGTANAWALGGITPFYGKPPFSVLFRWQGARWRQVSLPSQVARNGPYAAIGTVSGSDTWLVGGFAGRSEHWDGRRWTMRVLPAGQYVPTITATAVLGPANAWAFGSCCTAAHRTRPYIAHWRGRSWARVKLSPAIAGIPAGIRAVSAVSATDIWALVQTGAGSARAQLLHWNGHRWYRVGFRAGLTANLPMAIRAFSATSVWVGAGAPAGTGTEIEALWHWNGTAWTSYPAPAAAAEASQFWSLYSLTPDGHGGLWALGLLNYSGLYRIWDFRNGQWTGPVTIGSLPIQLTGLTAIPGTTSYFAYGSQTSSDIRYMIGMIARYRA